MVHIIKVYFENSKKEQEIRRLAVTGDVVSNFLHLLEKIQHVFQLPNAEDLEIKWRDPENDYILMSSNDELAQALANAEDGLLRLYISLKKDKFEGTTNMPKCHASKDIHPFVVCDGCDKKIVGFRYKCLQCKNYDLCSSCDAADQHPNHDMIKFVKPTYIPREWVFMGARKLWKSMFSRCPSNFFTYFEDGSEPAPNADNSSTGFNVFSQCPLNADSQAKDNNNTVPKSASSNSADSTPSSSTSQQAKEKSSPNPAQQIPLADFAKLPQVFMNCLQNDFVDAPKLLHEGLNQVLKAVQGTIEAVDHSVYKPEFRSQENINKTASSASNVPTQVTKSPTVEEPSTSASNEVPEVIPPHATNEHVDGVSDNDKSSASAVANENEDEILIDTDDGTSPHAVEEPAASCTEGWTLLDGGDASRMECNAVVANAPERVVEYPDLMEVEADQERSKDYIQTSDPAIISAVTTMRAMGFTNEGGWLERLLISKQGNINDALEALYPSMRH